MQRLTRTAKTARRLLPLTVLGALAVCALGAFSVLGAPSKPDFSLAVSPTAQSVVQGNSATHSVTITRQGGFADAVSLSVSGLAAGMSVSFSPPSPVAGATTTLTVTTTGATPVGNKSLTLTGTGGGITKTAAFSLNVQLAAAPAFNLVVTPSAQTISQDDSTSFGVSIARLNGFSSAVALSVSGLPKKTTGTFAPTSISGPSGTTATLSTVADANAEIGTFSLTVTASGGSPLVTRTATVTLTIAKKQVFLIAGNAATTLYPGTTSTIDLTLTNPNNFAIRVGPLTVSVEEHTSKPGCSGTGNFMPNALVGTVDVPGNTTATLSGLGVAPANRPKITFLDTSGNQDACKNAQITMQYNGTAVKP